MYRYIFGIESYSLLNFVAGIILYIASFFFVNERKKELGLVSRAGVYYLGRINTYYSELLKIVLAVLGSFLTAYLLAQATLFNMAFGDFVGTGGNYFATLIMAPIFWLVMSIILGINPLKQLDFGAILMPWYMVFVRLACFCNGCCWGVEWKYGLYNHNYEHPGRQVPVQLIEAISVLIIFMVLVKIRKKLKTGMIFPIYLISYSVTRFFKEFLAADYPDVLGPLKVYHLLCIGGLIVGIILWVFIAKFRDRINSFYEKKDEELKAKFTLSPEEKELFERKMQSNKAKAKNKKIKREKERKAKEITEHSRKL